MEQSKHKNKPFMLNTLKGKKMSTHYDFGQITANKLSIAAEEEEE